MFTKILFGTCLTEYCDHIFNFAMNLTKEHDAALWIFYGLGPIGKGLEAIEKEIKKAEEEVSQAYVERLKQKGIDYRINITAGDVVAELVGLARNAGIDLLIAGTSTKTPLAAGGSPADNSLGQVVSQVLLRSPCPVLVVPPALIPGLSQR